MPMGGWPGAGFGWHCGRSDETSGIRARFFRSDGPRLARFRVETSRQIWLLETLRRPPREIVDPICPNDPAVWARGAVATLMNRDPRPMAKSARA